MQRSTWVLLVPLIVTAIGAAVYLLFVFNVASRLDSSELRNDVVKGRLLVMKIQFRKFLVPLLAYRSITATVNVSCSEVCEVIPAERLLEEYNASMHHVLEFENLKQGSVTLAVIARSNAKSFIVDTAAAIAWFDIPLYAFFFHAMIYGVLPTVAIVGMVVDTYKCCEKRRKRKTK